MGGGCNCGVYLYLISPFILILGVHRVLVGLMAQKAEVKYDPAYIMPSNIAAAISDLGYPSIVLDDTSTEYGDLNLHVSLYIFFYKFTNFNYF